ncbi:aliphatic sulfonate ABC transporter substrate-binding protein [Halorubrum amylolyticum]|uniref:aliphatic sulfonate ABC transporter substrate-binding protein n=1 Tax=Halorubrum amylolyticum TaxID=2508724 RepID=UPI0010088472|nr:aliphatic sulfonate ABC transporter substrate-binding protein [Halorubrum amylolyticum]
MERRQFLSGTGAAIGGSLLAGCVGGNDSRTVTVDYAYYNPVSLVLREKGWMGEAFDDTDVEIEWVLSLGSNQANEYSQGGEAEVASTAGIAALMARSNGVPITTPYIYSEPEWTALVTFEESGIETVADLEGKRVAATRGTDPYFFLLQALDDAGLSEDDVEVVHLQHPEGQSSLVQGDVDAWAGLDPHMAELELEHDGAELFFREPAYNTYGFLNFLDGFLADHPEDARRVIDAYERGREWAIANPEETASILASESDMSQPVAERVFTQRNDLSEPIPGDAHRDLLSNLAPILEEEGLVNDDADPARSIGDLLDSEFAADAAGGE